MYFIKDNSFPFVKGVKKNKATNTLPYDEIL